MDQVKPFPVQSEAESADVLEKPVVEGKRYRLRFPATDRIKGANAKALVAQIEFLGASGEGLGGRYRGCFASERFGQYVYLATFDDPDNSQWSDSAIVAPDGAVAIRVTLHRWQASPALSGHGPVEIAEVDDSIFTYEEKVKGGLLYRLYLSLADVVHSDRAAVVQVRYMDSDGIELPGPHEGYSFSKRYGHFLYAGTPKAEATEVRLVLPVPEGAALVRLTGVCWKGTQELKLVHQPRLESSVPDQVALEDEWLPIGAQGRTLDIAIPSGSDGRHVLLRGNYLAPKAGSSGALKLILEFLDARGKRILTPPPAARNAVASTVCSLGSVLESHPFECFGWCPQGASRALLRILPGEGTLNALVHREAFLSPLEHLEAATCMQARLGVEESIDLRSPAFPEWRLRVDFEGLRTTNPLDDELELRISFNDARERTIPLSGIDTRLFTGKLHSSGNVLYVKPLGAGSGDRSVEHLRGAIQILPPPGAHTAIIGLRSPGSSELLYTCRVESCDALAETRLEPRSAGNALRVEPCSSDAAKVLIEHLLASYPDDPSVLAGAIDVYRRLGVASRMEALASRALASRAAGGKLKFKARHVLASLLEQDPDWKIEVPGAWSGQQKRGEEGGPLRVAHLFKTSLPYENTGGAIRCLNIVKFQKKAGMSPIAVTPLGYPDKNLSGEPWSCEDVAGIPHFRLNGLARDDLRSIPSTTQLEYTALLTAHLLREQGVDLIQASSGYRGYEQAMVGLAVARKLEVPFVYEVRSYHEHTWRPMAERILDAEFTKRRMAQENRCMREADAVVTICETMREGLVARGIPREKVFVVPNSVDLEKFMPVEPDPALRERLGLRARTTAGYISNLSMREGHDVLLRAVALARSEGVDLDCLIVGSGPELQNLKSLAQELGIADSVVFTGEVKHSEITAYYALIDIFVVPRVEDFASDYVTPMKPFEAMAMGRPVIISDRPALREVVEPGVRGVEFRSGDAVDLSNKLLELHDSADRRREYALAAQEWIKRERVWDATILEYERVYGFARNEFARQTA